MAIMHRSNIDKFTHEYDPKCGVPRGGEHNTIEDCVFFANGECGINVCLGSRWNLFRNNYGCKNEPRGAIKIQGEKTVDNLCIGNHCDPSPSPTRRRAEESTSTSA